MALANCLGRAPGTEDCLGAGHVDFTCRSMTVEIDGAPIMLDWVFADPELVALVKPLL